jgi:hypothetical protein
MAEVQLRVRPESEQGPLNPGDIYYHDGAWHACLPCPWEDFSGLHIQEVPINHLAKNGWQVTGLEGLARGDASQLTVSPSILMTHYDGRQIHGFITNGVWRDC